eukprot:g15228.t1
MDGDEETPSPAPTIVEPTLFFDLCYPFLDVFELQTLARVCKLPNAAHYWRSLWECKYSKLVPNAEVRRYLQSREVGFRGAIRIVRFLCAEVHRQEIGVWGSCSESEEPDHRRGLPYARYLLRTAISQRWEEDVVAVLREEKPQAKLKCPITIEDERLDVSLLLAIVSSQHSSVHALRTRIWSLAGFLVEAALDALCNEEDEHGIFYVPADITGGVGWTDARLLIQAKHEEIATGIDSPSEWKSARKEEVLSAAARDFVRKRERAQRCAAVEGIQFFLLWFSLFGEAARLIAARLLEHEDRSNASQLAPAEREANAREAGKIKKLLMPDAVMELISLADPSEFLSSYFIGPDVIGLEDDPLPEPPPDFGFVSEGGLWSLCFAAKPCSQAIAALLRVCARRPNHVAIGKLLVDCFFSRGETNAGPLTPGPLDVNALDSVHGVGHTQLSAFPLLIAAKEGHTDFVRMLVASRADVNLKDQNGRTALMVAVIYKRFETVQAMLRLPTIDLTVATNFRFNCLHYACLSADAACVREVLQAAEHNCKPRDDEGTHQAPHGINVLVELLECRDTAKRNTPLLELVSMLASVGGGEEPPAARSPSSGEEERERYGRPVAMADWYGDECVYDQSWRRLTPHDPVRENEIKKSVAHVLLFAARCRGSSAALSSVLLARNANGQDVVGICADKKRNDFLLFVRNFLRGLETTSSVRNARAVFEKRLQDAGFAVD